MIFPGIVYDAMLRECSFGPRLSARVDPGIGSIFPEIEKSDHESNLRLGRDIIGGEEMYCGLLPSVRERSATDFDLISEDCSRLGKFT